MGITVLKNNVPWGPFTRAQIEDGLSRRDFTVQYLAHAPGLKEWLPLGEVLHYVEANEGPRQPSLPPVPGPRELPPVPEPVVPNPVPPPIRPPILPASIPRASEQPAPPPPPLPVPPVFEREAEKPAARPEVSLTTASFILRGIAFGFDFAILFVPLFVLYALGALTIELRDVWQKIDHETITQEWALLDQNMWHVAGLVTVGFGWLYGAGLECSPAQATVGKRWVGIKVTDAQGERVSFLRATGRYAAKYLSALPCFLGFIAALFSPRGLALHDRLAGTRVVRR